MKVRQNNLQISAKSDEHIVPASAMACSICAHLPFQHKVYLCRQLNAEVKWQQVLKKCNSVRIVGMCLQTHRPTANSESCQLYFCDEPKALYLQVLL